MSTIAHSDVSRQWLDVADASEPHPDVQDFAPAGYAEELLEMSNDLDRKRLGIPDLESEVAELRAELDSRDWTIPQFQGWFEDAYPHCTANVSDSAYFRCGIVNKHYSMPDERLCSATICWSAVPGDCQQVQAPTLKELAQAILNTRPAKSAAAVA